MRHCIHTRARPNDKDLFFHSSGVKDGKFTKLRIGDEVEYQAWLFLEGAGGDSWNELLEVSLQATGADGIVKSNATAKLMALVQDQQYVCVSSAICAERWRRKHRTFPDFCLRGR